MPVPKTRASKDFTNDAMTPAVTFVDDGRNVTRGRRFEARRPAFAGKPHVDGGSAMLFRVPYGTERQPACPGRIAPDERAEPARRQRDAGSSRSLITTSRCTGAAPPPREEIAQAGTDHHLIGIALRSTNVCIFAAKRLVHDGRLTQGAAQVSGPATRLRAVYRSAYDVLHLHVPNSLVAECASTVRGQATATAPAFAGPRVSLDPAIGRLAHALMDADDVDGGVGTAYADFVGLAIVVRLLANHQVGSAPAARMRRQGLAKWRLERVADYLDANLAAPIGLADLAAAAGLSHMHFAAQFRAATGLRPHQYLLRQRIERAQAILASSRMSLSDVAAAVGFRTQAHFTTVFGRFVGETHGVWRQRNCASRPG